MNFKQLCLDIEAGYAAGRTMLDNDMIELGQELLDRTGEIKEMIDVIRGLADYNHFDVHGGECSEEYADFKRRALVIAGS